MKRLFSICLLLAAAALVFAGCSDVNRQIKKLDAKDCKKDKACSKAMSGLMAIPGAKPKLEKAVLNQKNPPNVRKNTAMLLGLIAESRTDDSVLATLEKALETEKDKNVRLELVNAVSKVPGKKGIPVMQKILSDENPAAAKRAADILSRKAREKMAEADGYDMDSGGFSYMERIYQEALEYNPCDLSLVEKFKDLYEGYAETLEDDAEADTYMKKADKLKDVCGAFVTNMYVALPFSKDFKKMHLNLKEVKDIDGDEYAGIPDKNNPDEAMWDVVPEEFRNKLVIQLSPIIDEWGVDVPGKFSAYATFSADSKTAQDVLFRVGTDVRFGLWVNGKKVYAEDREHTLDNEKMIKASLKKGKNRVVLKFTGSLSLMRYRLRISTMDNKEAPGLSFSL